jgi:hypothetical protein
MTVLAQKAFGMPDDGIIGDHFKICPGCGDRFDLRDLGAALHHLHDGAGDAGYAGTRNEKAAPPQRMTRPANEPSGPLA